MSNLPSEPEFEQAYKGKKPLVISCFVYMDKLERKAGREDSSSFQSYSFSKILVSSSPRTQAHMSYPFKYPQPGKAAGPARVLRANVSQNWLPPSS
jgi:hypothetical protein